MGCVLLRPQLLEPHDTGAAGRAGARFKAPFKLKTHDPNPWPRWLTQIRRRIETVFGQLVERLKAKRVWARDRWHLTSLWSRRLCAHTLGVVLCQAEGLPPLRFSELVAD